ncbi:MAG TPA: hypothetical protein VL527_09440 [Dongiaceae bacterium]|jgi:hypothetical protein|nr:hypothetical protein [Dongiaceae bacterium]
MQTFLDILRPGLALAIGSVIGLAFGAWQNAALRHHQKQADTGNFNRSGWSLMPGSGTRVASLLVTLVLIQLVCPMLFASGTQWWVSGGVLAGYGWILFGQLRAKTHLN